MSELVHTSISRYVTVTELLRMLRQAEASFGEIIEIAIRDDATVVTLNPGTSPTAPVEVAVGLGDNFHISPDKQFVTVGAALIQGIRETVFVFRDSLRD
jgi:hypothetical protein